MKQRTQNNNYTVGDSVADIVVNVDNTDGIEVGIEK
jgi:hypothetical protein